MPSTRSENAETILGLLKWDQFCHQTRANSLHTDKIGVAFAIPRTAEKVNLIVVAREEEGTADTYVVVCVNRRTVLHNTVSTHPGIAANALRETVLKLANRVPTAKSKKRKGGRIPS
jgi:hypothetical protein